MCTRLGEVYSAHHEMSLYARKMTEAILMHANICVKGLKYCLFPKYVPTFQHSRWK